MRASILIVGGGVMGTSVALRAARRMNPLEDPVVLLERSDLAAGSSGRSGAVLRQYYADRELCGMARDSLREYAAFERQTGYPVGFRRTGVLTVAGPRDAALRARLEANVATMQEVGIEVELLDAAGMRARVPGIEVAGGALGAFEPEGGFVDAVRTVRSFAALARFHGATVREGEPVERLVCEGRRVVRAETAAGPIEVDRVVLAAGPWNRRLLASLGVELPLTVRVPPQLFVEAVDAPPGAVAEVAEPPAVGPEAELAERFAPERPPRPVPHPVVLDLEHGTYARCEPDADRTRAGELDYAGAPEIASPDEFEDRVEETFARRALAALVRRLPAYADRPEVERQAALYTVTPDAQAILGPVPGLENAWLAAGFSGHGFKLAPSIGIGITQMLLGEPVSAFDPAFFDPGRFADGRARSSGGNFGM